MGRKKSSYEIKDRNIGVAFYIPFSSNNRQLQEDLLIGCRNIFSEGNKEPNITIYSVEDKIDYSKMVILFEKPLLNSEGGIREFMENLSVVFDKYKDYSPSFSL